MQPGWCQPVRQEFMENECEALPGVAYPGDRDNRSTINTKTGYDVHGETIKKSLGNTSAPSTFFCTAQYAIFGQRQFAKMTIIRFSPANHSQTTSKVNNCIYLGWVWVATYEQDSSP